MTKFDEALLQVMNDKQSGSVAVLQQLIRGILAYHTREPSAKKSLKIIEDRLPVMKGSLGHFEVVSHFLHQLENTIKSIEKDHNSAELFFDFVKDYDNQWKNANAGVASMALEHLEFNNKTILLHSNSSVITSLFSKLSKKQVNLQFIQTESRPENEGRYQAEKIAALGFEVKFVVDVAAAFMMDKVDMMLTGADQIHPDYFVNKIGTFMLALACREKNIPLHVLADSRKISQKTVGQESLYNIVKPGTDIWKNHPDKIEPVNFYFEAIPSSLVTSIITENELIYPGNI